MDELEQPMQAILLCFYWKLWIGTWRKHGRQDGPAGKADGIQIYHYEIIMSLSGTVRGLSGCGEWTTKAGGTAVRTQFKPCCVDIAGRPDV